MHKHNTWRWASPPLVGTDFKVEEKLGFLARMRQAPRAFNCALLQELRSCFFCELEAQSVVLKLKPSHELCVRSTSEPPARAHPRQHFVRSANSAQLLHRVLNRVQTSVWEKVFTNLNPLGLLHMKYPRIPLFLQSYIVSYLTSCALWHMFSPRENKILW